MRGALDCAADEPLADVDDVFVGISSLASPVEGVETFAAASAVGRVVARDIVTAMPLPAFDHSAVDGYGLSAADLDRQPPFTLHVLRTIGAGRAADLQVAPGQAARLFTGAALPQTVAAVVVEERCRAEDGAVTVTVPVPAGANIRRRGEDVPAGSVVVDAGAVIDARHVAMLTAAGVTTVEVRRRVKVAVLSNGNELREPGAELQPGEIHDANRPLLMTLLAKPFVEVIDGGRHPDDPAVLAGVFGDLAARADVVVSSGGVAGSDADHVARAVAAAGGAIRRYRMALKPGKPILAGRIGGVPVLGLPGNPVAAMVNFLLFGRAVVAARAGLAPARPRGQPAIAADVFEHASGRTEFVPVRIVGLDGDGRPVIQKLGRGGSARLRPLVLADGFAEIPAGAGVLSRGVLVPFHPFSNAFGP